MKKMLFMLLVLITNQLTAQTCPENFTAMNQGAVDNFTTLYPGCTSINGNLFIGGDVQNLDALSQITQVTGFVILTSTNENFDLSGLNMLTSIGTNLEIAAPINNLNGLNDLVSIGQNLRIFSCANLTDLTALNSVMNIGGYIEIFDNPQLVDLASLSSLTTIPSFLKINNNPVLETISGFTQLNSVGDYINISNNTELTSISGLGNLENVANHFFLSNAQALTNLSGLENLSSVGSYIALTGNTVLTSLEALNHPISIGQYISFVNNSQLTDCAVLSVCQAITNPNVEVSIVGNGPGCSSLNQVEDACNCEGQNIDYTTSFSWCGPYTFLGQTFTESGTYMVPFTNSIGCTGVATLNLTLIEIEYTMTVIDSTFTVAGNFINVTWVDCLNNFEPIVGAVNNTFVGSSSGSYAAVLNVGGCDLQTECFEAVAVEEPSSLNGYETTKYLVYPNPSANTVFIQQNGEMVQEAEIEILTPSGQTLHKQTMSEQQISIDLSSWSSGVYFIQIKSDFGLEMIRVQKVD